MSSVSVSAHNETQKSYFGAHIKKTMVPVSTPYVERHIDQLMKFAALQRHEQILDVGCGMGKYTLPLANRGFKMEGLDLSPFLLQQFKQYDGGRYNIPLYEGDVVDLAASLGGRYDALVGFFVLHHMYDMTHIFEACKKLLKPGGRMVFLEPNAFNPLYYLQIALTPGMTWQGDRGVIYMRRKLVKTCMEEAGLADFRCRRFGFFPRFVTNLPKIGTTMETIFESVPLWRPIRPFQLFMAVRPKDA